jgi:hypothetical protein
MKTDEIFRGPADLIREFLIEVKCTSSKTVFLILDQVSDGNSGADLLSHTSIV